jgi:cation diffusion facilitator family transporter
MKLTAGYLAGSLAVIADGLESAGDVVSTLILWVGLQVAARPADAEHPYGHGRYEMLAAQAIGVLLVVSGGVLGFAAYQRFRESQDAPEAWALGVLAVSIVVKLILARWKRNVAQASGSSALFADSQNDALDVASGCIAFLALGLAAWRPAEFFWADAVGGALIAGLVALLGVQVLVQSSYALLDTMPPPARLAEIREAALSVPGAWDIEKVHARKTGFQFHVDLHLEVDPHASVESAHRVAGAVRQNIRKQVPWVADVLIHIEPGKDKGSG